MPAPAATHLGAALDRCLRARGLTLRGFAALAGTSPATLSRLRSGRRSPRGLPLEAWGALLELAEGELAALREAALRDQVPEALRERLAPPAAEPGQPISTDCDGWWLAYHRSFANDGRLARTLARIEHGGVRWISMRDGELLYSYRGQAMRLGDRLTMQLSEDRGGRELVQLTVGVAFDRQRPCLLHGIVTGVSGSSFRRPLSLPTAARMVLLYAGSSAELAAQPEALPALESRLGVFEDRRAGPLPPPGMEEAPLRRVLGLGRRDDVDAVLRQLIDNRLAPGDHVLWAGAAPGGWP